MKRWQEEDTSIDDITCIIIFLNIQWIHLKFLSIINNIIK
jgi:hypothetical protein